MVQESAKTSPESAAGLYVIPTCQRSDIDLVRTGEVVENEKDRLLERVCVFMAMLRCHALGDWRMQTNGVLHAPQQVFASAASLITSPRRFSLLPQFCEFAKAACDALIAKGYWADYIDPCSGLPVRSLQSIYD